MFATLFGVMETGNERNEEMSNLYRLAVEASEVLRVVGRDMDADAIMDLFNQKVRLHRSFARGARATLRTLGFDSIDITNMMA